MMIDALMDALRKEAETWLKPEHDIGDWIEHAMLEPSDDLYEAYRDVDIEDDEEFEDMLDEHLVAAFEEVRS
jgi:hypothetical protein